MLQRGTAGSRALRQLAGRSGAISRRAPPCVVPMQQRFEFSTTMAGSSGYSSSFSLHEQELFSTQKRNMTSLSSISEPDPSLFKKASSVESDAILQEDAFLTTTPFSALAGSEEDDMNTNLRADVRAMGSLLGQAIRDREGEEVFQKVEELRQLAKAWREAGAGRDATTASEASATFTSMATFASSLTTKELFLVSRAFTHFLGIANAAEAHHRSRRNKRELTRPSSANSTRKGGSIRALREARDSCGGVLYNLIHQQNVDPQELHDKLRTQCVELVLTAHPTEVNRRTLLDKQKRVQQLLDVADEYRDKGGATPYQQTLIDDKLHREIASVWQSDEVSREKPTPQAEAENGTLVVETILWEAVPSFLRKLDATMKHDLGIPEGLGLEAAPIKFASWMGGDRDGNPNVTPNVTREVCLHHRAKAADLFHKDLTEVFNRLSITNCSEELREVVGKEVREPYRAFLGKVLEKLACTAEVARVQLDALHQTNPHSKHSPLESSLSKDTDYYISKDDLQQDLLLIHRSLCQTGNETVASGLLTDAIRNVSAFGLTLVPLDIRQESDRHMEALDAITRHLGMGSYAQWDEPTKVNWLQKQLSSHRPLLRKGDGWKHPNVFSATTMDTLETFDMIAEQQEGSLGAYVISQATSASDILAVLLLQKDAGVAEPLRVVPLFETLDDLNGAAETMDQLFRLPVYMGSIKGKQEVMIGYSDSAKDAGRLAASWAQYETQEKLAKIAEKHGVDLTFFHGKGGTIGRGGNPATFDAILSHAPGTIKGRFRVTEQGEMINRNFGTLDRAERMLDIYTAAVLAEEHTSRKGPGKEWRSLMSKLSDTSCEAYRKIVRGDERFVPYFRSATPELELSSLKIGSRPAKRRATGGVESLRAIPWIFAWTQTRLNLPTWLGVGEALGAMLKDETDAPKLRAMYKEWKSFSTTVDLVEMVLAKSEPVIAAHYDNTLVEDEKAKDLGAEIRELHAMTEQVVLELTGHDTLSENNALLRRALLVRNPYVDALNLLQAETLKRIRSSEGRSEEENEILQDALLTTINGVANGMGNTG